MSDREKSLIERTCHTQGEANITGISAFLTPINEVCTQSAREQSSKDVNPDPDPPKTEFDRRRGWKYLESSIPIEVVKRPSTTDINVDAFDRFSAERGLRVISPQRNCLPHESETR
jgi:hypothetical protein